MFPIFSTSDLYFPINIRGAFVEMPGEKMIWYEKNLECWMKIQQRKLSTLLIRVSVGRFTRPIFSFTPHQHLLGTHLENH